MSLFPKYIEENTKQAFQCKHCKTIFMAGPNEWHYVKPEERRMQDEKDWCTMYKVIQTWCPHCKCKIYCTR